MGCKHASLHRFQLARRSLESNGQRRTRLSSTHLASPGRTRSGALSTLPPAAFSHRQSSTHLKRAITFRAFRCLSQFVSVFTGTYFAMPRIAAYYPPAACPGAPSWPPPAPPSPLRAWPGAAGRTSPGWRPAWTTAAAGPPARRRHTCVTGRLRASSPSPTCITALNCTTAPLWENDWSYSPPPPPPPITYDTPDVSFRVSYRTMQNEVPYIAIPPYGRGRRRR